MFGGSMMGDPFGDIFGQMNTMMNSMFGGGSPFGAVGAGNMLMPFGSMGGAGDMPFGFPSMNQMMLTSSSGNPNVHSFSSSSMMTMTTGPDGKPQVYQASSSTRSGPGGVRETKKTVCDSRSGIKKMAIGHHIGDRGHVKEKGQNMYSGEQEESEEYINLDDDEAESFDAEWNQKAKVMNPVSAAYAIEGRSRTSQSRRRSDDQPALLALPPAPSTERRKEKSSTKKKSHRTKPYDNTRKSSGKGQK